MTGFTSTISEDSSMLALSSIFGISKRVLMIAKASGA